jgi:hypothetical protein
MTVSVSASMTNTVAQRRGRFHRQLVVGQSADDQNVTKSRISFQTRMRFAGIDRPRRDHIVANFVLTRPIAGERVWRVEPIAPYYYVHRVRLYRPEDVDDELMAWMDEARQVGDQRHLDPGWDRVTVPTHGLPAASRRGSVPPSSG